MSFCDSDTLFVPYLLCSATNATQMQLSIHARKNVDKISPDKDVARLVAYTLRSLASAIPDPILYEHGLVGSCNDLIFGFSLGDYATAKCLHEGEIPKIVRICIEEIDKRGLEIEGIYRVASTTCQSSSLQLNLAYRFQDATQLYSQCVLAPAALDLC